LYVFFIFVIQNTANNETKLIILVDDNNYYQSMRRMYSRIAKKHDYGFCQVSGFLQTCFYISSHYLQVYTYLHYLQVYMKCDESLAAQRVQDRNGKLATMHVTPQDVQQMSSKIEPPNHSSAWESSSLIIDTNLQVFISFIIILY
jgi:tRNA uridine 5-carbamoylmethylation protein Kti12